MKIADELGLIEPVKDAGIEEQEQHRRIWSRAVKYDRLGLMKEKMIEELERFEDFDQIEKLKSVCIE